MANYTKLTNFAVKDTLLPGSDAKVVRGSEVDAEFEAIEAAVNSKLDANSGILTGSQEVPLGSSLQVNGNFDLAGTFQVNGTTVELDENEFSYLNGVTSPIQTQLDARLTDAPSDGTIYGRRDAAWVVVEIPDAGPSLPAGGTADQLLVKIDAVDNNAEWRTLDFVTESDLEEGALPIDPDYASVLWHYRWVGSSVQDIANATATTNENVTESAANVYLPSSMEFNGTDSRLEVTGSSINADTAWTFKARVRNDDRSADRPLFSTRFDNASNVGMFLYMKDDGQLVFGGWETGGTYRQFTTTGVNLLQGTWYEIEATWNGVDTIYLFVDGLLVHTEPGITATTYGSTARTYIGHLASGVSGLWFAGVIEEIQWTQGVSRNSATFTPPATPFPLATSQARSKLLPAGGSSGQVLAKIDATDYNVEWADAAGGGGGSLPAGGTAGQILSKIDATDFNAEWTDAAGGGFTNEAYLWEADDAEGQNFNPSIEPLEWKAAANISTGASVARDGLARGTINFNTTGVYKVFCNWTVESPGANSQMSIAIQLDTGGGFSTINDSESWASCETNGTEYSVTTATFVNATAGNSLQVLGDGSVGSGSQRGVNGACYLMIERIS